MLISSIGLNGFLYVTFTLFFGYFFKIVLAFVSSAMKRKLSFVPGTLEQSENAFH